MKHILRNTALLLAATVLLLSCENPLTPERGQRVSVSAVVENMGVELKSETDAVAEANVFGGIGTTPLNSKLIYTLGSDNGSAYVTFTDNKPEWIKSGNDYLIYGGYEFSTIGLYPATSDNDGWTISDGKVTHQIDGSTDLMFAPKITSKNANQTSPTLQYEHLLTWINVLVSANTIDAISHWGKIRKITIESSENIEIGLTGDSIDYSATNRPITVYNSDEGLPLNITTTPAGSVLVSPKTTLKVTVYTTVFTEGKSVNITLRDLNNQDITNNELSKIRGKLFVLNLTFTPLSILEGTCTLNYWNDQDEDLILS